MDHLLSMECFYRKTTVLRTSGLECFALKVLSKSYFDSFYLVLRELFLSDFVL